MSPRRKYEPGEQPLLVAQQLPPKRWRLPLLATLAAMVMVAAVAASTFMLVEHESQLRTVQRDREAISYVKWFMERFTSLDPFNANEYITRILDQATGDFHREFESQANQILLQVARSERSTGTVLDAGVERWNDDGSANVLVATEVTSKSPDGKQVFESTSRWSATARQEGNQWKISNLQQVI